MIAQAWYIEALHRTKRLPKLQVLLDTGPARPVTGEELAAHKREFNRTKEAVKRFEQNRRSIR